MVEENELTEENEVPEENEIKYDSSFLFQNKDLDGSSFFNFWFPFPSLDLTSMSLVERIESIFELNQIEIETLIQEWITQFNTLCSLFWPSAGALRLWTSLPPNTSIQTLRFTPTSTIPIRLYGFALR